MYFVSMADLCAAARTPVAFLKWHALHIDKVYVAAI